MMSSMSEDTAPVICKTCNARFDKVIDFPSQAWGCAASIWQVTDDTLERSKRLFEQYNRSCLVGQVLAGDWVLQGHFGSTHDTTIYRLFGSCWMRADPVCDECVEVLIRTGLTLEVEGRFL